MMGAALIGMLTLSLLDEGAFNQHFIFINRAYFTNYLILVFTGVLVYTFAWNAYTIGVWTVGVAKTNVLTAVYPFFTIFFSLVFLNEGVAADFIIGTLIIFSGVFILLYFPVHQKLIDLSFKSYCGIRGEFWGLINGIVQGALPILILIGSVGLTLNPIQVVFIIVFVGWIGNLIIVSISKRYNDFLNLSRNDLLKLIVAGLIYFILGLYAYFNAIFFIGSTKATTMTLIYAPISMVGGVIFLKEKITYALIIGSLCVMLGLFLTYA